MFLARYYYIEVKEMRVDNMQKKKKQYDENKEIYKINDGHMIKIAGL